MLDSGEIVALDCEVEVGVRPRLFAKKRIDSSSSINPEGQICLVEGTTDSEDVIELHRLL
jgi:hypothetical protein